MAVLGVSARALLPVRAPCSSTTAGGAVKLDEPALSSVPADCTRPRSAFFFVLVVEGTSPLVRPSGFAKPAVVCTKDVYVTVRGSLPFVLD